MLFWKRSIRSRPRSTILFSFLHSLHQRQQPSRFFWNWGDNCKFIGLFLFGKLCFGFFYGNRFLSILIYDNPNFTICGSWRNLDTLFESLSLWLKGWRSERIDFKNHIVLAEIRGHIGLAQLFTYIILTRSWIQVFPFFRKSNAANAGTFERSRILADMFIFKYIVSWTWIRPIFAYFGDFSFWNRDKCHSIILLFEIKSSQYW